LQFIDITWLAAPVESELVEQLLTAFKNKTPEKDLAVLLDTLVLQYFPELLNNRDSMFIIAIATVVTISCLIYYYYSFSGKES